MWAAIKPLPPVDVVSNCVRWWGNVGFNGEDKRACEENFGHFEVIEVVRIIVCGAMKDWERIK